MCCRLSMADPFINLVVSIHSTITLRLIMNSFAEIATCSHNWTHCTIDFNVMDSHCVVTLLQKYGHLIRELKVRGSVSPCLFPSLPERVRQSCPNLQFVDCFGTLSLFPLGSRTRAFSMTFPSALSVFSTVNRLNTSRNTMYSMNDCVMQQMILPSQTLSDFQYSIWQFEIKNHLQKHTTATFNCMMNGIVVGTFSIQDSTVGGMYSISLLFPLPPQRLALDRGYVSLAIQCSTQLPFGSGYVCISSLGRLSLLKSMDDTKYVDPSVPPFVEGGRLRSISHVFLPVSSKATCV